MDLLHLQLIDDPYVGDNEAKLQWIGLADWQYRLSFEVDPALLAHPQVDLLLDGLDTYAEVSLNGHPLISTDNMFRHWRVAAKSWLRPGQNLLEVQLHSPIRRLQPRLQQQPYVVPGAYDSAFGDEPKGRNSATYVRKAQYQYGWDWGPRFVTEGIWQPVYLQAWDQARVDNLHVEQQQVSADSARLQLQLDVVSRAATDAELQLDLDGPDGGSLQHLAEAVHLQPGINHLSLPLQVSHPQRWYPAGYGAQPLYHFAARLQQGGAVLARAELTTGLRKVELRRDRDSWGRGFAFVINDVPIFVKGANMVPLDSFPSRVTPARHLALLQAARDAHMNMLRVWGGGYYETDDFYAQADRLGILIWQDFMFGGAIVPAEPALQENARVEAVEQVRRLRDHPSIVLWCGNNEVQADWDVWVPTQAFKKTLAPALLRQLWASNLQLFGSVLRKVVADNGGGVPYWATSPGNDLAGPSNQLADGDYHSWKVWAGSAPIEDYLQQTPRFMSEFGLQSFPDLRTIDSVTLAQDRQLDSPVLLAHQKFGNGIGNQRLLYYIRRYYGEPKDFPSFVYLSQLMQAEGIELAVDHLRASRPRNMGVLYWQLNDAWPAASWSSIDYAGRWKALQYHARRFYAPMRAVALRQHGQTQLSLVSDALQQASLSWRLRVLDFNGRLRFSTVRPVQLAAAGVTPVAQIGDRDLLHGGDPRHTVAVFELLAADGSVLSRQPIYFASANRLQLPAATPQARIDATTTPGHYLLQLGSPVLLRGLWISFGDLDARLADNAFDLLPGDAPSIAIDSSATLAQLRAGLHLQSVYDAVQP
jgi:beta-mannosidase